MLFVSPLSMRLICDGAIPMRTLSSFWERPLLVRKSPILSLAVPGKSMIQYPLFDVQYFITIVAFVQFNSVDIQENAFPAGIRDLHFFLVKYDHKRSNPRKSEVINP